jgi:hypothetical protein
VETEVEAGIGSLAGFAEPEEAGVVLLPQSVQSELEETDGSLGVLGRPFDRRTPFLVGLTGGLGVAVALSSVEAAPTSATCCSSSDWPCSSPSD